VLPAGAKPSEDEMPETSERRLRRISSALWPAALALAPMATILGFGAVALTHPNSIWTSAAISAAILGPLAMIVAACYGSPARRPFRAGFAIAGGIYLLLFSFMQQYASLEDLATSKAIEWSYTKLFPASKANPMPSLRYSNYQNGGFGGGGAFDVPPNDDSGGEQKTADSSANNDSTPDDIVANGPGPNPIPAPGTAAANLQQDEIDAAGHFWIIGHSLWTLIIGWLGGCFAQFLAWRQRRAAGNANPN
jgi:hypothetical protein